jgi:AraC-like DNA-binding protein
MGFLTPSERHGLDSLAESSNGARFFPADTQAAIRLGELSGWTGAGSSLQLRCQLIQVISLAFSKELNSNRPVDTGALFAGSRIGQLMARLTEAELLEASAPVLAKRCGCSVRHFNRLFLQTFGESFRNKQTELRLSQAQRLLSETDLPVKEVARCAGFKHLGIFYARFKRLFAMTPVECRRRRAARPSLVPSNESAPRASSTLGNPT